MLKRVLGITVALLVLGLLLIVGGGIWLTEKSLPAFTESGYVLQAVEESVKQIAFSADENYKVTKLGVVTFTDASGETASVEQRSFLHLDGGAVSALSDGVLLDFNDLSANFINNYYITQGVEVAASGEGYTAQTDSGTLPFGDHLWKLSDDCYMVESPSLTVHFSEDDERAVSNYVEVRVTEDGIVQLLTEENKWSTISEECYIQTASGVKVYPITQLVENDEYKMSLAKLAVNTDDSIVLTDDELRRQIVPELNITTIDGKDGENGTDGTDGAAGTVGSSGEDGNSGSTGENGTSGKGGASGSDGGNGTAGKDAMTESTINSALPTMTITEWEVTATTLRGQITVKDEAEALGALGSAADTYAGTVTIYNEETGEAISCYHIENLGDMEWPEADVDTPGFTQFAAGQEDICFATLRNALTPDTTYRLSVVAYYQMNDMIYSREFISRLFYTDSTGVILSKHSAEENALTVNSSIADSYAESVTKVEVYLLTPEQNASFTVASTTGTNYEGKYILDYQAKTVDRYGPGGSNFTQTGDTPQTDMDLKFQGLTSNTRYIARVYVETRAGLKTITNQELELYTLKRVPTWTAGDKPTANYNRATGAFEIFRPAVSDPDSGVSHFIYTAYDSTGNVVRTQEVQPAQGEPVSFFLPSGDPYTFKVEAVFNDNEKEVTYDLGISDPVQSFGDKLPHVELSEISTEYNEYKGDLTIQLTSASSALTVANGKPLTLSFYADSLNSGDLAFTVEFTGTGNVNVGKNGELGTASYSVDASNYPTVHLDLKNLYKNTNYTIVVSGWLNVGDGNGAVFQTVGTTGFRTYNTINLAATWSTPTETTGTAISRNLRLAAASTVDDQNREAYALSQLKSGSVRLELYNGTGVNKVRIAYTDITTEAQLTQLFGSSGITVTENTFGGSLSLSPSVDYTLVVSTVTDGTYNKDLGYQNTFDSVASASLPITAQATPPDLLTNPAQGVKVTPIYNKDAALYGEVYDKDQPDDLLIGYKLESTYDNVQRLGYDVTYYAMEYSEFYNAIKARQDPIYSANKLVTVTQPISVASDTVPAVALLFGGTPEEKGTLLNNCYVYHTGEAQLTDGSSLQGMGRGYRYVFAYTVRYSATGNFDESQLSTYPYGHGEYSAYKEAYGAGQQFGKNIGLGVAYVLNSGMYEAPRMDPEIHTMVYNASGGLDASGLNTTGTLVIQYKYKDLDDTIVDTGDDKTQITWTDPSGIQQSQDIDKEDAKYETATGESNAGNGWKQVAIRYTLPSVNGQPSAGVIAPKLEIDRYGIDYSVIMNELTENTAWEDTDADAFYLCQVPVDWAWDGWFKGYDQQLQLEADTSNLDSNIIKFTVNNIGTSSAATSVAERLYAMKLNFTYKEDGKTVTVDPIYLPITVGVNGKPYAELATGRIAKLVGKVVSYSAELLYDNGDQGWKLVQGDDALFALQTINGTGENSDVFGFSSYFTAATGGTSNSPSGALSRHLGSSGRLTLEKLYNSLGDLDNPTKVYGQTQYLTSASGSSLGRYYYIDHSGMDASTDSSVELLTGRYVVPKGCGTISVKASGDGTFQLTSITPAIAMGTYRATTTALEVWPNYSIDGAENATQGSDEADNIRTVYMAVFPTQEAAEALAVNSAISRVSAQVQIDSNGTAKPVENVNLKLGELTKGTTYYLAVYMMVNGKPTILMDAQSAQKAIYRFTAVNDVVVESAQGMVYYNNSYFDKYFRMSFKVSPYLGFEAHYAIYAQDGDYENQPPLLDEEALMKNSMLSAPTVLSSGNCELNLNMEPSERRSVLKPGGTYYLRVYITEAGGTDVVGEQTFPFTVSPVGNTGALIYAQDATKDSVTFQVTLSDPQFSFMGRKEGTTQTTEGALYAVRFVAKDKDGKEYRLVTDFDDELYHGSEIQKPFTLTASSLTMGSVDGQEIKEATQYTMYVFAVPDYNHDGIVANDEFETVEHMQNYTWYFNNDKGSNFQNLINQIWDNQTGSYLEKTAYGWVKEHFLVGQKTQQTTDSEGVLINEDMASILRVGTNSLQLNLAESYGIVTVEGDKVTQNFPLVKWSVTGLNVATILTGESRVSKGDTIFQATEDAQGYDVYTYNIPAQITSGSYKIVIQLYQSEEALEPYKTLSLVYRG